MFCQECNKPKTICQDTTPTPCECPVQVSTDCILYQADESTCSGIPSGVTLTEYLEQLDTFICNALEEINTGINLINVGTGLGLYKGIDVLGRREIKSLITNSNILTLTANTNDITFGIDEEALDTFIEESQKTYSASNVGTGVQVYKDSTIVGDNIQFNFKTLTSSDNSVQITNDTNQVDFKVSIPPQNQTYVENGDNIVVTGDGTISNPYIISTNPDGSETKIQGGVNVSVTGDGTISNPYIINSTSYIIADEEAGIFVSGTGTSEDPYYITKTDFDTIISLQNGVTTQVIGNGTEVPYSVEVLNLQKEISANYTLQASDHLHTIFLTPTSLAPSLTITIPETGLPNNFVVGFYHVSPPGEYSILFEVENDLTQELRVPSGFIASMNTNGNFSCMIERRLATQEYMLNGDLTAL